ncbi:hypothetical protein [Kocuria sp.]|uniref:hypothetical protein n=1 Tax=Kocuria sp. TaxID=1871328 RepID=UPI0026DF94A9|nr:hypothetical protein [Kocuria sp.]MDO5619469.1 hypothetical protein [Kocuria sp.]
MKFSMENDTLSTLGQRTSVESDDLGSQVRRLVEAAEPLEGVFNGAAKSSFDSFKANADNIANALNSALGGIVESISGQDRAFGTAAQEGAETHSTAEASSDFSGAEFLSRIAPQG